MMATRYNMTNLTNANNLYDTTLYINSQTYYAFGIMVILALFLILFMALKRTNARYPLGVASFICATVSFIFQAIDLVGDYIPIVCMVLAGIAIAISYYTE